MRRLINVRVPLFCALGLVLGVISCKELLCGDFYFGLILGVLLMAGLGVALVLKRAVKVIAVLLCFALLGFGVAQLSYHVVEGKEVIAREVTVTGRVCDLGRNRESATNVYYLENCVDVDSGEKFRGRIQTYYHCEDFLEVGDVVTVSGVLNSTYPIKSSVNSFEIRNKIYYELDDCKLQSRESGRVKFDEKARRYVFEVAIVFAPENYGVVYALLTGDRGAIESDVVENFQRAGTLHLLAVSGLHVGFVVALVAFALKRFKLHPLVECGIILVPLLFYAYICGFSPSVTRAVTMTVCVYLSRVVLGRYDMLTSLSISAVLLIFLTPYTIFDAGFQLSFLSVFGIATLHASVTRLFLRRKINRFVRYFLNAFLLSASCSLATLFVLAVNFGQVPLLGVFVNLFAIPLVTVVFVLCVFGMLPWVFHYLLFVADKLLIALIWLNEKVSNLSFATVSITALSVSVAIVALLMFIVGGFVNLRKIAKRVACVTCALLLVATVLFAMIPSKARERVFVSFGYGDTVIAATSNEGEAVIVGNFSDNSATTSTVQFLSKYRLVNCKLFITDFSQANQFSVNLALDNLPVTEVYLLMPASNDSVSEIFAARGVTVKDQSPNSVVGDGVSVRSIYNGVFSAVNVRVGKIDVCFATSYSSTCALQYFSYADLYVLSGQNAEEYSAVGVTTFTRTQTNLPYNYGANKYGNFTIRQKDDKIIFSFS